MFVTYNKRVCKLAKKSVVASNQGVCREGHMSCTWREFCRDNMFSYMFEDVQCESKKSP